MRKRKRTDLKELHRQLHSRRKKFKMFWRVADGTYRQLNPDKNPDSIPTEQTIVWGRPGGKMDEFMKTKSYEGYVKVPWPAPKEFNDPGAIQNFYAMPDWSNAIGWLEVANSIDQALQRLRGRGFVWPDVTQIGKEIDWITGGDAKKMRNNGEI